MNGQIILKDVSYTYPDGTKAISNISIAISEGERVALIGPNGSGKSTLLLHLNGILRGSGTVTIDGEILSDDSLKRIRRKVGMIFQDPNDQLFCPTVGDDVSFGPLHFGLGQEALDDITRMSLERVGMAHAIKRPAHHLSLGERRRVTIAAVLACQPTILALDEPAAMLDSKRRKWLIDFLNSSRNTVILATHDLGFALDTCRRAILISGGRITADGGTREIISDADLLRKADLEP